jgi:hypothetical protein
LIYNLFHERKLTFDKYFLPVKMGKSAERPADEIQDKQIPEKPQKTVFGMNTTVIMMQ